MTLLLKPQLRHRVYHLSAGDAAVSFREIGQAVDAAKGSISGSPYVLVTHPELVELQDHFAEFFGWCNRRFMLRAMKPYGTFSGLNTRFVNDRLLEAGIPMPVRFTDYLAICLITCLGTSIAEQMLTDFQ